MNWTELMSDLELVREQTDGQRKATETLHSTLADMAKEELLVAGNRFLEELDEIKTGSTLESFLANIFFLIRIHEQSPSLNDFLFKTSTEYRFGPVINTKYWANVILSEEGVFFAGKPPYLEYEYAKFSPELTIKLWNDYNKGGNSLICYFAKLSPSKILRKIWKYLK